VIDVHTHLHPPRLFAAIRRWFAERSDWNIAVHPTEPADVAAVLRDAGVEHFVFCSYAHKPGMAAELNAWLTATARDLGGFGIPLATVHLDDPDPLGDLVAALDGGCAGIKIHEDVQRLAIDDPRFGPVFDEIARRRGIVLAHIGPIPWVYDTRSGDERVARTLERHPELQFVVAHMGVPDTEKYFAATDRLPNLYLDTTMVFAAGSPVGDGAARDLVERYSGRILYGTDYPNIPYEYGRERAGLAALGLSEQAFAAITGGNARVLLADYLPGGRETA
jgi:predicted TIM-barrel fold metal-dependent hydrolase